VSGRARREALALVKRNRYVYWAARKARAGVGSLAAPRTHPPIPGRVHPNDFMLEQRSRAGAERYCERARNVITQIDQCLGAASQRWADIETWLDLGCGYGRVLRFLVGRVPPERVLAADVIREAVDFCAAEFGVRPVYLDRQPARIDLEPVDFLYAISIITHLTEQDAKEMLRVFGNALEPGGLALFTTHGRRSLERIELYGEQYLPLRGEVSGQVEARGVAFVPYGYALANDYGMTWHSEDYIRTTMSELHGRSLELVLFEPHGLDGHQDVFAFRRIA
jgi:SAM-dependent methyltransferase